MSLEYALRVRLLRFRIGVSFRNEPTSRAVAKYRSHRGVVVAHGTSWVANSACERGQQQYSRIAKLI